MRSALARTLTVVITVLSLAVAGTPAHADPVHTETYKSNTDGLCISTTIGSSRVFMGGCGGSAPQWIPAGPYYNLQFVGNNAGCLDSNAAGQVYAITCNGGGYQRWYILWMPDNVSFGLRNNATGLCLSVDAGHNIYTQKCAWVPNSPWLWNWHLFS